MAKKKIAKKKSVRKTVAKKVSLKKNSPIGKKSRKINIGFLFVRLVLILLIVFGGYKALTDWTQGVYIISGVVVIWLVIELIKTLRK